MHHLKEKPETTQLNQADCQTMTSMFDLPIFFNDFKWNFNNCSWNFDDFQWIPNNCL